VAARFKDGRRQDRAQGGDIGGPAHFWHRAGI
jgi:hypothetical protein